MAAWWAQWNAIAANQVVTIVASAAEVILRSMATVEDMDIINDDIVGFVIVTDTGLINYLTDNPVAVLAGHPALLTPSVYRIAQQVKQIV